MITPLATATLILIISIVPAQTQILAKKSDTGVIHTSIKDIDTVKYVCCPSEIVRQMQARARPHTKVLFYCGSGPKPKIKSKTLPKEGIQTFC